MADVKVKMVKDHNANKKGATGYVSEARANYLVRCGAAVLVTDDDKKEVKPKTKAAPKKTEPKTKVEPCKTC